MLVQETEVWRALQSHQIEMSDTTLKSLFAQDSARFKKFSLSVNDLYMDYSKQRITSATIDKLCQLANKCELAQSIQSLFAGEIVNKTEQRPALHMALRDKDPRLEIKTVLEKMESFVSSVHSGDYLGETGKCITDIISLGIGGSDLGPVMICEALKGYATGDVKVHFVSNVDMQTLENLLEALNPASTLCLINSKTFTTIETLSNAKVVRNWFINNLSDKSIERHLLGVTANLAKALEFGLIEKNIFEFWDWVGGRYSVWSAVGLPIALTLGMDRFRELLSGAHVMDKHFVEAEFTKNMPVLMGLLGIWNINFFNANSLAIMPYLDGLKHFPDYLQQLEMESNGKYADYQTAPVIWGGVGCNGQHAYMQLLHQGTQIIPVDFLVAMKSQCADQSLQNLLIASCLGQSQALMLGRMGPEVPQARVCPGNRPSTTLMFPRLTPKILGSLIALYEHKVFVQGVIWQIQSFDQWGVELGKQLIKDMLPIIQGGSEEIVATDLDSSTGGLLALFMDFKR